MTRKKSKTSFFTNRGQHFGNTWNVYSHKIKQHLALTSDIELCHWVLFLEFNRGVLSFTINPLPRMLPDPLMQKIAFTAEVMLRDGSLEWHLIVSTEMFDNKLVKAAASLALQNNVEFKIITETDLIPNKYKVLPLLRVASCLSAGKSYVLPYDLLPEMHSFVKRMARGTIGDIVQKFSGYGDELVLYAISRLFSEGNLSVNIAPSFFSEDTAWEAP